jgi:hypothetical protein
MKERWLLARITAPFLGTFSRPRTHGRKVLKRSGPTT